MEQRDDFLGFTFAGIHSSELNIIRTSGGDRFDEQMTPEIRDISVEVPGMNGEYFFGSTYGTRTFKIEIAFDSLTEAQFRKIRQLYGRKQIGELIFDERPYKKYLVKIESPIELSYVCFDEPNYTWEKIQTGYNTYVKGIGDSDYEYKDYDGTTKHIYKGEGTISFICYFPFAKSVFKELPTDQEESDWVLSSGILNSTQRVGIDEFNNNVITVYNPGDIEVGFRLYLPKAVVTNNTVILTYKADRVHTTATLALNAMTLKSGDVGVLVDTNSDLITGVSSAPTLEPVSGEYTYTTSGNLYNQYVNLGSFFHLKPNDLYVYSTLQITGGASGIQIFYDYLYF